MKEMLDENNRLMTDIMNKRISDLIRKNALLEVAIEKAIKTLQLMSGYDCTCRAEDEIKPDDYCFTTLKEIRIIMDNAKHY